MSGWIFVQNDTVTATLSIDNHSPPDDKIALFADLFRGRQDVYPRRFESRKTGRAGYAPACGNEWLRGICEKPRVKCADCVHRQFLAVGEEVIRWHLSGSDDRGRPFVMGVYPMLLDESCHLLAADFDKGDWLVDALAFLETCRLLEVPAALERSRSGKGGHVWLFFESAIPCALARRLGSHLLTETMERRPEIGFGSYDRFFPNQDTMPRGGFGNLIALPLQHQPRRLGNCVFIDPDNDATAFSDQWAYLSGLERMQTERVEALVDAANKGGRVVGVRRVSWGDDDSGDEFALEPWAAPASRQMPLSSLGNIAEGLPEKLSVTLGDGVYLPKKNLTPPLRARLLRLAAFQNPEFHRAQAMRLSTWDKPRIIHCADDGEHFLTLPRGCLEEVIALLEDLGIAVEIDDQRNSGELLQVEFQGRLRSDQKTAARAMLAHDTGVLAATTAFGKTVLAAWLIAKRGVNTLVLVHRQQLMEQWVERLASFLDFPEKEIGRLGGGRRKLRGKIDIALIQSLVRKGDVDDRVADYGHVIVDECHHISARSFELAVSRAKAKYVSGLSATVVRKDGHHPIVFMQCGPVRHRVDALSQAARQSFSRIVLVRPTPFPAIVTDTDDARLEYQRLCREISEHAARNEMICADIASALDDGRFPLVLTERTGHLGILAGLLETRGVPTVRLLGGMRKSGLRAALEQIDDDTAPTHAILATGRFVGEGFDHARLDTLFLTMPVSWRGTVAQYAGRLHRMHEGKREVRIYDYADFEIPMLARMFDKRQSGYEAVGYTISMPASALPGWPAEVPLPVDAHWKQHYLDSARRLIRDGIDVKLAELFSQATRRMARHLPADAVGTARARSASEAFLFHRLESLPETRGHFQLNQLLPIPFGERHEMEVDLLCRDARLVIEVDGPQHLDDVLAYRRDRHKDALLQERGYLVLRFLAEDIGTRLDQILDTVLRVMAGRSATQGTEQRCVREHRGC